MICVDNIINERQSDIIDLFRVEVQLEMVGDILAGIMMSPVCEEGKDFKEIIDKSYEIIQQATGNRYGI